MTTSPSRLVVYLAATALFAMSACSVPGAADLDAGDLDAADQPAPAAPKSSASPFSSSASATPKSTRTAVPSSGASVSCTSNYSAGAFSLDMIMQNNTSQTLVLDPTRTGRGNGHWAAQPPSDLAPGACAVINAYSDDPLGLLWVTATYLLPDGTFIPFACEADSDTIEPQCNTTALLTMTETTYDGTFSGTVSDAWQVDPATSSGVVHSHWTLIAEPQQ